jgi:serine protease Do
LSPRRLSWFLLNPRLLFGIMAELLILALGTIAGTAQNSAASDLYKRLSPSVFESADGTSSLGSSVVISSTQLLTNYHVIRDGKCFLDLGTVKVPLSVERFDSKLDLALLKTETRITANAVQLATSDPIPGASIWAIGNPEGLERSISQGIVSAVRDVDSRKYLQITAPISHGSSGGGIFDGSGILVGISVAFLKDGQNLNAVNHRDPAGVCDSVLYGPCLLGTKISCNRW